MIVPVGVLAQEGAGEASLLKAALGAGEEKPDHSADERGAPLDGGWVPCLVSEGAPQGRDRRPHVPRWRGTAVTRLALIGVEVPEIAAITGHSLRDVHAIPGRPLSASGSWAGVERHPKAGDGLCGEG